MLTILAVDRRPPALDESDPSRAHGVPGQHPCGFLGILERRVEDGRWELPTAEMAAQEVVAMEAQVQEDDQEIKERRIQELALQLLHDEAILAEG